MSTINYGELINKAKEAGYDGGIELPNGTYDVTVGSTNSSSTNAGDDQIGVQFAAVSGAGTVWMNQIFKVDRSDMLAIFFNVMGRLGLAEEWFTANHPTMEQIASTLAGVGPFRIQKTVRKTAQGGEFPKVKILGAATGETDVVTEIAASNPAALPTVPAPTPATAPPAVAPAPAAEVPSSPPVAVEPPAAPAPPVAPPATAPAAVDVPAAPWAQPQG